jgi:hypothetical protein
MKRKKLIFAILIIFLFSLGLFIQGQDYDVEIQATWGGSGNDFAYSLAVTSNNLFLAGYTNSFSGVGAFLAKFTLSPFNVVWSKGIGITGSAFYDVAIDIANIFAVGYAFHDRSDRPVIIKFAQADGSFLWARYLHIGRGGQPGRAFSITTLGAYYCLSGFLIKGKDRGGIFACFNTNGNLITGYSRFFSTSGFDDTFYPYGIASFSSNLFLVGNTSDITMRGFIAKYDGTSLLVKTTPDSALQNITSIAVDNIGNLYITGQYSNSILLAKFDSSLNVIYTKRIQITGNEIGYSIALDPSNNIYIGGRKGTQPDQAILVKLDNSGNKIWCKSWNGTGDEGIFKIRVDSNNEVHAAGFSGDINGLLNDIECNVSTITVNFGPISIDTKNLDSSPLSPSIITISGNLNTTVYNEALYLKISPVVTTTVTTTSTVTTTPTVTTTVTTTITTTTTVTTTPTTTTTETTTLTTTSTATATATLTTTATTTLTTTTTTTITGTTITVTACSPILLRVNEIEKINNVLSLNQILYFSLFTSISLTFLFSYMIISNRRKIKWKKQR